MHRLLWVAALVLTVAGGSAPAWAWQSQSDDLADPPASRPGSVEQQLRSLQEQLQGLRSDNARMKEEIDLLRAQTQEDWLTEKRAEQIRGLVADVLADADERASLLQSGLTAGWSEHFFIASPDGRFKLQLEGQVQIRYLYSFRDFADRHRAGFENSRTKLTFRGHVFDRDWEYLVRTDITRNEPGLVTGLSFLQDAFIRRHLNDSFSIKFGQFKSPFNREELVPSSHQLAVERSLVNENTNLGRTQGVEITWSAPAHKLSVAFADAATDNLGGFGTVVGTPTVINTPFSVEDSEWTFIGRYEFLAAGSWQQFADFTSPPGDEFGLLIGVGMLAQLDERNSMFSFTPNENDWYAYTVDVSVEMGGANLFASWTHHFVDAATSNFNIFGAVAQGGFYFLPKWEAFARFEYGWWEFDTGSFPDLTLVTVGTNYYIDGHDLKWTTDFGFGISRLSGAWDSDLGGWRIDPLDVRHQIVFRTQFQLLF